MNRVAYWSIVITVLAFAAIPVLYSIAHLLDKAYRDSFFANWAATVIGVIVGIPIALELNRRETIADAKRSAESRQADERQRRSKILSLLRTELINNKEQLVNRQVGEGRPQRQVLLPGLKDELWHAFSDGGELQWIQDLDLLDAIATAYYRIRTIIYLEERFFEAAHFPGMQIHQDKYPKDHILEYLKSLDPTAIETVGRAIESIDRSLERPVPLLACSAVRRGTGLTL
jgi:hypothetical protein